MDKNWSVYRHVFPNGKMYIGITSDIKKRWRNGSGYKTQKKMQNAINKYGWENVNHEIILDGLDCETAKELEMFFIEKFDTVNNGYNSSIGGDNISTCFLNNYLLEMCQYYRRYGWGDFALAFPDEIIDIPELCYRDRYDKGLSDFWNNACEAVVKKHGKFSTTHDWEVHMFWWHMLQFYDLAVLAQIDGRDMRNWKETSYQEYIINRLQKKY